MIDAKIPNREAGFVRTGQSVRIKVDAFPFTDYGTIKGRLESVSKDAVEDEKLGPIYRARIRIRSHETQQSKVKLSPGMLITAEIKMAQRRVI